MIRAALIDVNGGGSPELFVQLMGGFCGSLGCSITLHERGTNGRTAARSMKMTP